MDYTNFDNDLLSAFFLFFYYLIFAFVVLTLAWFLYEKFLGLIPRRYRHREKKLSKGY